MFRKDNGSINIKKLLNQIKNFNHGGFVNRFQYNTTREKCRCWVTKTTNMLIATFFKIFYLTYRFGSLF